MAEETHGNSHSKRNTEAARCDEEIDRDNIHPQCTKSGFVASQLHGPVTQVLSGTSAVSRVVSRNIIKEKPLQFTTVNRFRMHPLSGPACCAIQRTCVRSFRTCFCSFCALPALSIFLNDGYLSDRTKPLCTRDQVLIPVLTDNLHQEHVPFLLKFYKA
eukprot:1161784-Pelagomonas_calceolata.AAC.2